MEKLDALAVKKIFGIIKETMNENKEWLFKLDSEVGDGDLGISMSNGFQKVFEGIKDIKEEKIGVIFMKAGFILSEEASSTLGTLIGSSFIDAGEAFMDKTEIGLDDFSRMIGAIYKSIMENGNSKPGEKTILDVIYPVKQSLEKSVHDKLTLEEGLKKAYIEAKKGFESTRDMIPKHGRVSWYGEKAHRKLDPGAGAGMLLIKSFFDFISRH